MEGYPEGKTEQYGYDLSPWIIEITAVKRIDQMAKSLRTEGGYRITHQGNIRRSDSDLFSVEDVRQLLEGLELFLSFAKGAHCGFPIATGMNEDGERVWQQAGINDVLIRSWRTAYTSWFDPWHGRILEDVFSRFWRWFEKSEPSDPVKWALDWYILSNEAHVAEGGLILAMAALERLSHKSFPKRGKPGKRIANALEAIEVPINISSECPELAALQAKWQIQKDKKWDHGPHALVKIRDDLAHAEMDYGPLPSGAYVEAWNLGQWYAELMLLSFFGYNGCYGNRLKDRWRGQVEPVPWTKLNKETA